MKLEKYEDKNKKKRKVILVSIGAIVLISVSLILYKTFASFSEEVSFPIMKGKVDYFGNSDVYFAFYKGNELLEEMPSKENNEGLVYIDGECDNGASIEWNKEEWAPLIKNLSKSKTKCTLYFNDKYIDRELNGADPELGNKLIPIVINEENGKVTRASEKEKWYDYDSQKWANAVILRDGKVDPGENQPIDENDIESYFVWIPRYRYQIFDEGNYNGLTTKTNKEQIIDIKFETKDVEPQTGTNVGQWLTHPAFTSFDTNGIWVGKFETGYDGAGSTGAANVNPANEVAAIEAANKVIIKPNVYSWRYIQVAKAYTVGLHYEQELNSHMMKNTEWGAVAYLQHSKYGSHTSVRINNNYNFLTGYAAVREPTTGYTATNVLCSNTPEACNEYGGVSKAGEDGIYNTNYFNKASVVASTTGNYSGIYDMSGGAWEYMMSGVDDNSTGDGHTGKLSSGRNNVGNSEFNGKLTCPECNDSGVNHEITEINDKIDLPTDERYYDKYDYGTSSRSFSRGKFGDATKEMGPFQSMRYLNETKDVSSWYNNEAGLAYSGYPWLRRSGYYGDGTGAGMFFFRTTAGNAFGDRSFRLVLAL